MKKSNIFIFAVLSCFFLVLQLLLSACDTAENPKKINKHEESAIAETEEPSMVESVESDTEISETTHSQWIEELLGTELIQNPLHQPNHPVLELSGFHEYNGPLQLNHTDEIDLQLNTFTVKEIPASYKSVVFQIGDLTMTATYEQSMSSRYYQDSHDCYEGVTDDGKTFVARFQAETRKLSFFKYRLYQETQLDMPILSEQECKAIAEDFFFRDMGASGEYEMEVEYRAIPSFSNGAYLFKFRRIVDEIATEEYAEVHVAERGRIIYYNAQMWGTMDSVRIPTYNEAEIRADIEHKLVDIYEAVMQQYTCTYEILWVRLTRLYEDGQLYLVYSIHVHMYPPDGDYHFTEGTTLLVPLA